MNTKQMIQEIKDKFYAIPERQISTGLYVDRIGRKYITVLNTWNSTSITKYTIERFYEQYM